MVLESTMICLDNSEYMRNEDFIPNRLTAQEETVQLLCHLKLRQNPSNEIGLMSLGGEAQVLASLTTEEGHLLRRLHQVTLRGTLNLVTGLRIAQFALKHRREKGHKSKIVLFLGSPIGVGEDVLIPIGKKFKKEKIDVEVVCFGDALPDLDIWTSFIASLNGKGGEGSRLEVITCGPYLVDRLMGSPIFGGSQDDDLGGGGYSSEVDPELAMALSMSLEEYNRTLQKEDPMSQQRHDLSAATSPDNMSEDGQMKLAMELSLKDPADPSSEQLPLQETLQIVEEPVVEEIDESSEEESDRKKPK